jgi:hypothetical protein
LNIGVPITMWSAALEFGDEAVRHLDGGGAFRRMLLARREGPADPGKIYERRGRPHQIADDDGGARARGFPPVDEKRGEFSGGGKLMARADLDRKQGGHLAAPMRLIAWPTI